MKIVLKVFLSFLTFNVSAQRPPQTPQELEAFAKNMLKRADSMQAALKKMKTTGNPNTTADTARTGRRKMDKRVDELPGLDSAKVNGLPKKVMNAAELKSYMTNLYDVLSRKFLADAAGSAKTIAAKLGNDPAKLEAAALHGWLNGADEEAVLLIVKGAAVGGDGLVLSNAGGILDMYGLPEKAIPVLRTVIADAPQNVIALNNLGQAYTAVGLRDSAMHYFNRCLRLSPQHPEANNTAGHIELKKGNNAAAKSYFENSLRGSFNISAYSGLAAIFKDDKSKLKIGDLIRPKVKKPEYFNQFKFNKFPKQCYNVNEAATVRAEFEAYKNMLNAEIRKYDILKKEAATAMGPKWAESINKGNMEKIMRGESIMKPFQAMASIIVGEANLGRSLDGNDLMKFDKEHEGKLQQLSKEFEKAMEYYRSGHHNCAAENEIKNKYMQQVAPLISEWQSRHMQIANKYIDDVLYWCYFSSPDINSYRSNFYSEVYTYLYEVNYLAKVMILEPCEEKEANEVEKPEPKELKEFDCPVDLQLPFIVGKMTFNCEKFTFKAGEGVVFKYEKKFKGHRQTTISIGAGGGVDADLGVGPVKAGFSAGLDMSVYLTFDKAGDCTDAGMTYSAGRSIGLDFSAGERINIKKDLGHVSDEFGWRFGINSGVSFTTPDVPWMRDKPETPVNKNVKIHKQQ